MVLYQDATVDIYDVSMEQVWNVYTLIAKRYGKCYEGYLNITIHSTLYILIVA